MSRDGLQVLIVDDEIELAEIMKISFESTGHDVAVAINGKDALNMMETRDFDVVLTDVRMPVLDGVHLLEELRDRDIDYPPVILMTAYSYVSPEDAYQNGATGVLEKPCATDDIISAVERSAATRRDRWLKTDEDNLQPSGEFEAEMPDYQAVIDSNVLTLGRGGLFIALPASSMPEVGDTVRFAFTFSSGNLTSLKGYGRVMWVRTTPTEDLPTGCGIEFLRLDNECIEEVIGEIEQSKVKPYIPKF